LRRRGAIDTICLNPLPFCGSIQGVGSLTAAIPQQASDGSESDLRANIHPIPYSSRGTSMKKSVFFVAALALALTACGDNNKAAADAAKAASDKAAAMAKEAADKAATAAKDAGTAAMQAGASATDAAKAAGGAAVDAAKADAAAAVGAAKDAAAKAAAPAMAPADAAKK
jgi:hypothetical protein